MYKNKSRPPINERGFECRWAGKSAFKQIGHPPPPELFPFTEGDQQIKFGISLVEKIFPLAVSWFFVCQSVAAELPKQGCADCFIKILLPRSTFNQPLDTIFISKHSYVRTPRTIAHRTFYCSSNRKTVK